MSDDYYPNDGTHFAPTEPEEQVQERKEEEGKLREGARVLEDVIARLESRIQFYSSIDSIEVDLDEDPSTHQKRIEVAKMTKTNLLQEKEYWQSRLPQ